MTKPLDINARLVLELENVEKIAGAQAITVILVFRQSGEVAMVSKYPATRALNLIHRWAKAQMEKFDA